MNTRDAFDLCRRNEKTFIVTMFPAAGSDCGPGEEILEKHGRILFRKSIPLEGEGPFNLIRQVYAAEKWLGSLRNGYRGARRKTAYCFPSDGAVNVYVYEAESVDEVNAAKKAVRDRYRISNHSIHINDTHDETVRLAKIVLNENSVHALNHARLVRYQWFYPLLARYRKLLLENAQDPDNYCLDGSSALAIYGIREARDLDYLHCGPDEVPGDEFIGSHNEESKYHVLPIEEIVRNPENHFYFHDVKFVSLDILLKMKQKRGEAKDVRDCAMIDSVLAGHHMERSWIEQRKAALRRRCFCCMMWIRKILLVDRLGPPVLNTLRRVLSRIRDV